MISLRQAVTPFYHFLQHEGSTMENILNLYTYNACTLTLGSNILGVEECDMTLRHLQFHVYSVKMGTCMKSKILGL